MKRSQITNTIAANLKGVSLPTIRGHVLKHNIIYDDDDKIDLEDPVNISFFGSSLIDRYYSYLDGTIPDYKIERIHKNTRVSSSHNTQDQISEKVQIENELKAAQRDLKRLEYGQKLGILVDSKAMQRKFGVFQNFIINDLITLPDTISDMLTAIAQTSDDPVDAVKAELRRAIKTLVENAKSAASEIEAPLDGVEYVIIGKEDDEQ